MLIPSHRLLFINLAEEIAAEGLERANRADRAAGLVAHELVGEARGLNYSARRILEILKETP